VSSPDPFDDLGFGTPEGGAPEVRRRDLREPSTRRSRATARKRSEGARKAAPPRSGTRSSGSRSSERSSGPRSAKVTIRMVPAKKPAKRRVAAKLFSIVALSFAALLIVATSVPSSLFAPLSASADSVAATHTSTTAAGQKLTAATGSETPISRDAFQAMSSQELTQLQSGAVSAGYTVDNSGPIRWPFDFAVPLGDPFGPRAAPCSGCSTFHNGTDFETGGGAPIYAVADGTVTQSGFNGSLGESVSIDHVVNGNAFTSIYGHMTSGSQKVKAGQTVKKGDLLGLTGSTGESTGPHLFVEIDIDATPIDSFKWLKANTKH
jgi:murein DD-endopeptidase MepM/ murein hydrolase activator NlpD